MLRYVKKLWCHVCDGPRIHADHGTHWKCQSCPGRLSKIPKTVHAGILPEDDR